MKCYFIKFVIKFIGGMTTKMTIFQNSGSAPVSNILRLFNTRSTRAFFSWFYFITRNTDLQQSIATYFYYNYYL